LTNTDEDHGGFKNKFEDAVVASVAEATGSDYILTRNVPDFAGSPVPAMTPTEFLETLAAIETE
jgi:hypothetical protein